MTSATMDFAWAVNNHAQVVSTIQAALHRGLMLAGEHILAVSNKQVPLEEGDLARTGTVSDAGVANLTVAISYDTPYAVRQHEDLSYRHDAGRNAKYLERACRSEQSTAGKIVAASVRGVVGS